MKKLNIIVKKGEKARSEDFNATTAKVDELIDALSNTEESMSSFDEKILNLYDLINQLEDVGEGYAIIVDPTLDPESKNAIQNKAVAKALEAYQKTLVSGESIKTINGQSILGNGNIEVVTKPMSFDVDFETGILSMDDGDSSNPQFSLDNDGNLVFEYV